MSANSEEIRPVPDGAPNGPGQGLAAEALLWRRLRDQRDPAAREELVRRYLPFAKNLALRYRGASESFDDLLQVANLGLVNAVDRFDPARGTPFAAFASPTILGELKRQETVLDPYLLIEHNGECACLGIWENKQVIACAE